MRAQAGAVLRIGQGELDEGLEVALEVADVEPLLAGRQRARPAPCRPRGSAVRMASVSWISSPLPGGVRSRQSKIAGLKT